ncbi:MAG: tetratricopeptide repeat protein [Acidobacteria bacterium]|nr:tetratricopeptide repeat protein [Acidobacteriota bacterium]
MTRMGAYWIFSPLQDLAFILVTPLPILLVFTTAQRGGWIDALVAVALALAMAHYLPGILRAYGDRALFRRFRTRLIIAPLVLIGATVVFAYLNFNFVFLLVGLWGAWHWLMQVYGFARIYDARVESEARMPARLDQILCMLWFGMCLFVLNNVLPMYVSKFYESGGPVVPATVIGGLAAGWLGVTAAVTLFYVAFTVKRTREGRYPNPLKLMFLAVSFAYLAYTASMIDRPIVGYAMFESWHDIQYLAIVWLFNLNRSRNAPETGAFTRFLFRPRAVLLAVYVGLCLMFGSLTHAWRLFEDGTASRVVASLVMGAAFLHYYLDGFIWKIRDRETREGLNIRAEGQTPRLRPAWAHALLWLLFVIPGSLFFVMESKGSVITPLQLHEKILETFPDFPQAHYQMARELQAAGRHREARIHYERTLALAPDFPDAAVVYNNLGIICHQNEEPDKAKSHFEDAVRLNPDYALAHNNLGIILAKLGDLTQARTHYEQALRIDLGFVDAHYQLGLTLAAQGDFSGAAHHLEEVLRINPDEYLAHNSLGAVLVNQGKLSEAKSHFEQALRIRPDYVHAQQNLQKMMESQP